MAADETAVLLNISDMIDLAIGTPEVGVVDFNMLQTVLHCLAQQLRVLGKNVELRGSVATLPVGRENNQTIAISEFVVDTDDNAAATKTEIHPSPSGSEPPTILVVERVKKSDSPTRSPPRDRSPGPQSHGTGAGGATGAAAGAPRALSSTERLSLVTLSKFNLLESTVEDLKNRVYGSMPKNEEILEEVRSQTNLKAITDMWTNLNVSSRLEAAEAGISKLSSLVQDVISETSELQDALKKRSSKTQLPTTEATAQAAAGATGMATGGATASTSPDLAKVQANLDQLRADLDQLSNTFYRTMTEAQTGFEQPTSPTPQAPGAAEAAETAEISTDGVPREHAHKHAGSSALNDRINALEKRMKECCDKIGVVDGVVQDNINSFQDQLENMMRQVATLESGGAAKMTPDVIKDLQGLMQLFQTVQDMQGQLKQVHETALQLAAEKEDRQIHVNALLEQIELLKTVKLDREDMVEAMADKADLRMLARKVSHDQFELACDDLSRGLEHALGKLSMQEALWQQALDDIQREIETKLDKMELSPVKDFFNNKLKQLQENLKQMSSLRREAEAAGTKRRLLRDVNCISCDAKAVMPMEAPSSVPVSKPMPATLSMKPYLSYELERACEAIPAMETISISPEDVLATIRPTQNWKSPGPDGLHNFWLKWFPSSHARLAAQFQDAPDRGSLPTFIDAIRKTQASNIPQRNMRDWETIDKQASKPPAKAKSDTDKHLCNRYCGGSHTVTTPAQRVARLGHFIKQWGPDVLPLSSGLATGDDGRMYKVTATEAANVGPGGAVDATCTPKSPEKKVEPPKPPPRSIPIVTECRCLEGDQPQK